MNRFPEDFNTKANFKALKNREHLEKLRQRIYSHYINNGDSQYFDIATDLEYSENIQIIINELEERGFNTKKIFNDTAILIYIDPNNVRIWLENLVL